MENVFFYYYSTISTIFFYYVYCFYQFPLTPYTSGKGKGEKNA